MVSLELNARSKSRRARPPFISFLLYISSSYIVPFVRPGGPRSSPSSILDCLPLLLPYIPTESCHAVPGRQAPRGRNPEAQGAQGDAQLLGVYVAIAFLYPPQFLDPRYLSSRPSPHTIHIHLPGIHPLLPSPPEILRLPLTHLRSPPQDPLSLRIPVRRPLRRLQGPRHNLHLAGVRR